VRDLNARYVSRPGIDSIGSSQRRLVAKPHTAKLDESGQYAPVVVDVIGGQEVDVFRRSNKTIGYYRKPANYDKTSTLGDHGRDGNVELRIERVHRLVRRLAIGLPPARRDAVRA
jgi:hypothetical protein